MVEEKQQEKEQKQVENEIEKEEKQIVSNPPPCQDNEGKNDTTEGEGEEKEEEITRTTTTTETTKPSIDDLRQMGNHEFGIGNFDNAVILYSQALIACDEIDDDDDHDRDDETNDGDGNDNSNNSDDAEKQKKANGKRKNHKYQQKLLNLCNRSACYYCMEKFELAHDDASKAWNMESTMDNIKAAYRLVKTQLALGHYEGAKNTIDQALKIIPKNEEEKEKNGNKKDVNDSSDANKKEDDDREKKEEDNNKNDKNVKEENKSVEKTRKAFEDLSIQAYIGPTIKEPIKPDSLKWQQRLVSIREFTKTKELGYGNFSEIYQVVHNKTKENFALKCILKKKAEDLAKRQHPNVYNEIEMERRVLMERIPPLNPYVVKLYHSFEDYNTIYYLMDLHCDCSDLWSQMRYDRKKMVGCHYSQIQIWMLQIIDAIEFIHSHGIVHRDLKPENILLNKYGDIIVIDFGTAKDLIQTDLNGPEFVGTPDFMSPEAVQGTGGMPKANKPNTAHNGADCSADLWAIGAIAYILHTGETPFWSPSPYLAFLKIKRCQLKRPWGIVDDDAWDFITSLMKYNPSDRLCSDAYTVAESKSKMKKSNGGYDPLRNHPYLSHGREQIKNDSKNTLIPTLQDLCIRACAELVINDSTNVEICDRHPPGDKSSHDVATRLQKREKQLILHFLDKRKLLTGVEAIRLYERFFVDILSCRLNDKIRIGTHDYIGYTQMNDDMGKPPSALNEDPYAKPMKMDPLKIAHITNPLLTMTIEEQNELDDKKRKKYVKLFKKTIATINRTRPKLVIVCGVINDACRKLLCRISDSIPIAMNDSTSTLSNSTYYTVWHSGIQCILLQSKDLLLSEKENNDIITTDNDDDNKKKKKTSYSQSEQMKWLREYLEQCRMSKHPLFVFVDCDPRKLPNSLLKRIARGKVQALFGLSADNTYDTIFWYRHDKSKNKNKKKNRRKKPFDDDDSDDNDDDDNEDDDNNKKNEDDITADKNNQSNDDDISIKSTSSDEDEKDDHSMKIMGAKENAIRWITMEDEHGEWQSEFMSIELPPPK